MSDELRPGEIDLDTGETATAVAEELAAEPAQEETPAAEATPAEEPAAAAEPEPAPEKKPNGLLAELIEERKARRALEQQITHYAPVLQRLTPEMQQAILEGRVLAEPPKSNREAERERLAAVAEQVGLYKVENGQRVPDLDAAKRVDGLIRSTVREEVAPMQHQAAFDVARKHYAEALNVAANYSPDVQAVVKEEFDALLSMPNGAQMLRDGKVAMRAWDAAIGRAVREGKLTPAQGAAATAAAAKPSTPPAIPADTTARRAPGQAAIRLSPALQKVYRDHGLDPATASTSRPRLDYAAGVDLE